MISMRLAAMAATVVCVRLRRAGAVTSSSNGSALWRLRVAAANARGAVSALRGNDHTETRA
jgi:hypothetical protein